MKGKTLALTHILHDILRLQDFFIEYSEFSGNVSMTQ